MDSTRLYSKKPNDIYGDYFYIHRHIKNIGRMGNNGTAKSSSEMAKIFNSYKSQIGQASQNQYINLMKKSINLDLKTNNLIKNVLDVKNNNIEKVMKNIHNNLQSSFEKQFDENQINKLLTINQSLDWSSANKQSIDKLQKSLNDPNNMEGFYFLDEILTAMSEACSLIQSEQGSSLAAFLISQVGAYKDTKTLGVKLGAAMTNFINENEGKALTNEKINQGLSIAKTIQTLAKRLETGKSSSGKDLSVQSIQGSLQKNFFPAISEVLATQISAAAEDTVVNFIANEAKISGTDQVLLQVFDAEGNLEDGKYFLADTAQAKAYGKADGLFNVSVDAEAMFGKSRGQIKMTVGVSSKAYVTNQIGGRLDDVYEKFSLGKGFSLGLAFKTMGLSLYDKYLGYNVIAKDGKSLTEALIALQDIILTRSIVYLAAGRGAQDFSQLLLLNGKVMSMWDIILYATGNNIGKSSSMLPNLNKNNPENNENGVYMSIPSRPDIIKYSKDKRWNTRIQQTNEAINKAIINLHIVPKKIIDYSRTLTK